MITYLRTFLPWITFALITRPGDSRYGALAGATVALVLVILARRAGRAWDTLVIEAASAVFFAGLAVAAFTVAPAPFGAYGFVAADAWLALTAWGSLAAHRPFTLGIARTMAPPEVHGTPLFYRLNVVITAAWAASFTVTGAALAVLIAVAPHATAAIIAVKICGFAVPAVFTARYPDIVRARAERDRRPLT